MRDNPMTVVPVEPDDDQIELALRAWDADLETEGWDRPWQLASMRQITAKSSGKATGVWVWPMDFPQGVAPKLVIRQLLHDLRVDGDLLAKVRSLGDGFGGEFVGLVMAFEAWMVDAKMHTPAQTAALEAAYAGRLYEHPDRIEVRYAYAAVPPDGAWALVRRRGELAPRVITGSDDEWTGVLPRLLMILAKLIQE